MSSNRTRPNAKMYEVRFATGQRVRISDALVARRDEIVASLARQAIEARDRFGFGPVAEIVEVGPINADYGCGV